MLHKLRHGSQVQLLLNRKLPYYDDNPATREGKSTVTCHFQFCSETEVVNINNPIHSYSYVRWANWTEADEGSRGVDIVSTANSELPTLF